MKILKLPDLNGYTYDMKVAQHLTVTHATVTELARKIKNMVTNCMYTDGLFSSRELFDDLATKQVYCCGTSRQKRRGMSQDLALKHNTTETGRHLMDQG
jgi:hypothetical protein